MDNSVTTFLLIFILCFFLAECSKGSYPKDFYELESSSDTENVLLSRWKRDESKNKKIVATKKPTQLDKSKPMLSKLLSLNSTQPVTSELNITNYGITNSTEFNANDTSVDDLENILDAPLPSNYTSKNDSHTYYNSTILTKPTEAMKYWVDIDKMPNVTLQPMLSKSHRRAAPVNLTFEFPFYGNPIKNVTIATGGFLYLGNTVHSWLAATQYVAPLMANFDTRLNESSKIKYADNSTMFVVQWENVLIKELPQEFFTFQVSLFSNGDIVFVYKDLPISFNDLPDTHHPVKVGLSDAYVIDRTAFFIRKKTIYEYHRVELKKENILNNTAIYFTALPTCITLKDCESCSVGVPSFECKWCESTGRCSDGLDRQRQDWLAKSCDTEAKKNNCLASTNSSTVIQNAASTISPYPGKVRKAEAPSVSSPLYHQGSNANGKSGNGKASFMAVMMVVSLISGVVLWLLYAYKNPQSSSGQFLIKYRPAQWRFAGSEARYTAASIHM